MVSDLPSQDGWEVVSQVPLSKTENGVMFLHHVRRVDDPRQEVIYLAAQDSTDKENFQLIGLDPGSWMTIIFKTLAYVRTVRSGQGKRRLIRPEFLPPEESC